MTDNIYKISPDWLQSGTNLVYFGDLHWRKNPPRARIDDFRQTELNKIKQVRLLASFVKAKAILQPGDLLDVPREDDQLLAGLMTAFGFDTVRNARMAFDSGKTSQDELTKAVLEYIPMIGLVGNHELVGGSLKSYGQSSLRMLADSGFLTLVNQSNPYLIKTSHGLKIAITGANYDNTLLPKKNVDLSQYTPKERYGDVNIFMVHEALYNTQLGPGVNWLPISEIWDQTLADITIAGHIHYGFGWVPHNGKLFGNPGALAQQSISENELDRTVTATVIHIFDDGKYQVRDIVLPGTKPVRNLADLSIDPASDQVADMISLVDHAKTNKSLDPAKIVEDLGKNEEIDKKISDIAIKAVREAQVSMGDVVTSTKPYKIASLDLINFEAYTNAHIDFADDITLFVGESGNGKSSILRALYWIFENEGKALNFIHKSSDADEARVILTLDNGTKITRYAKSALTRTGTLKLAENGYLIEVPGQSPRQLNTEGVEVVDDLLGFHNLMVDEKTELPINFLKQGDGWYFINMKGTERAKVIGAIYKTQYIAQGIKDLDSQRKNDNRDQKKLEQDILSLKKQLLPFRNLDEQLVLLNQAQILWTDIHQTQKRYQRLKGLYETYQNSLKIVTDLNQKMSVLTGLDEVFDRTKKFSQQLATYLSEAESFEQYQNLQKQYRETYQKFVILSQLPDHSDIKQLFENYQRLVSPVRAFIKNREYQTLLDQKMSVLSASRPDLIAIKNDFDKTSNLVSHYETYTQLRQHYKELATKKKQIEDAYQREFGKLPEKVSDGVRTLDDTHIEVYTDYLTNTQPAKKGD